MCCPLGLVIQYDLHATVDVEFPMCARGMGIGISA